jgi:hypothetical protein
LIGGTEHIGAMRAGGQRCLDDAIRVFGQHAVDAGTAPTALPQSIGKVRPWREACSSFRGLGWRAEPGFQLCNPRHQPSDLRSLRLDLSNLRQDQADLIFLGQSEKRVAIHEYGESSRRLPCQA